MNLYNKEKSRPSAHKSTIRKIIRLRGKKEQPDDEIEAFNDQLAQLKDVTADPSDIISTEIK